MGETEKSNFCRIFVLNKQKDGLSSTEIREDRSRSLGGKIRCFTLDLLGLNCPKYAWVDAE
jgi:hypothetical protein